VVAQRIGEPQRPLIVVGIQQDDGMLVELRQRRGGSKTKLRRGPAPLDHGAEQGRGNLRLQREIGIVDLFAGGEEARNRVLEEGVAAGAEQDVALVLEDGRPEAFDRPFARTDMGDQQPGRNQQTDSGSDGQHEPLSGSPCGTGGRIGRIHRLVGGVFFQGSSSGVRGEMKLRNVAARGESNPDNGGFLLLQIILREAAADIVGANADDGVGGGLIFNGTAEDPGADEALGQAVELLIESSVDDELEQILAAFAGGEVRTLEDGLQLSTDGCLLNGSQPVSRRMGGVHRHKLENLLDG